MKNHFDTYVSYATLCKWKCVFFGILKGKFMPKLKYLIICWTDWEVINHFWIWIFIITKYYNCKSGGKMVTPSNSRVFFSCFAPSERNRSVPSNAAVGGKVYVFIFIIVWSKELYLFSTVLFLSVYTDVLTKKWEIAKFKDNNKRKCRFCFNFVLLTV